MLVTVNVTDDDIMRGRRFMYDACPVALAIKRKLSPTYWAWVDACSIKILPYAGLGIYHYMLMNVPEIARSRIIKYDYSGNMEPFSFEIDIDSKYLKPEGKVNSHGTT